MAKKIRKPQGWWYALRWGLFGRNGGSVALCAFQGPRSRFRSSDRETVRPTKASPASKRKKRQTGKDQDGVERAGHEGPANLLKSRAMMRRNLFVVLVALCVVPLSAIASTPE